MKNITRALTLLIPILLALTLPAKASAAAQKYSYQSSGQAANVEWYSFDGCVSAYTFVAAWENRSRVEPGSPTEFGVVEIAVFKYDYCTGEEQLSLYGSAQVGSGLRFTAMQSARLTATLPVYDYLTGNTVQVGFDLAWTGEGEVFRSTYQSRSHSRSLHYQSTSSGSFRYATVAGGLSIDGVSQTLGTPYYSTLVNGRSSSTTIYR